MHSPNSPVVLTIAGSDSGGDAGIQADLAAFNALHVHGVTAVTCLTAQNPRQVSRVSPCPTLLVRAQLDAVGSYFKIAAAKTGMLYSAEIVREVLRFMKQNPKIPLVVDPVLVSTSGRRLLQADALRALRNDLLPRARIVTPNLPEAEILVDARIHSLEQLREAAKIIHKKFGCAVVVKGGHLADGLDAVDFYFDGETEWVLSSQRIRNVKLHGTGCTFSAALAAAFALGKTGVAAVELAKNFVTKRICESR